LGVNQIWGSTNVGGQKKLGAKKFGVYKKIGDKIVWGSKNVGSQKMLGVKQIWESKK
jgi:hypothetical protein